MKIRRIRADEGLALRTLRLAALADSPMAYGSTFAREDAYPDAVWHERRGRRGGQQCRDDRRRTRGALGGHGDRTWLRPGNSGWITADDGWRIRRAHGAPTGCRYRVDRDDRRLGAGARLGAPDGLDHRQQ